MVEISGCGIRVSIGERVVIIRTIVENDLEVSRRLPSAATAHWSLWVAMREVKQ